ncbi:MAG: MFS transporter, partial [Dehalococcoidales bacterium]|nr:MFS transporter [Dehalococcoidales bacterium]
SGLFWTGAGIGGAAVPLMVKIIDKLTWQTTLLYAAAGFLIIGIPLSLVYRSRPEDYGLLPDGREANTTNAAKGSGTNPPADFGTSVKEALKTRAFWHLGVITLFQFSVVSTMSLYAMPYLTSLGMDRSAASMVVMYYMVVSIFARVPAGMLSDIFRKSNVIAISVALQTAGVVCIWLMGATSPLWLILLFALSYGLGVGGVNPLRGPILKEYFGIKNFGAIFGLAGIFQTLASVLSQPLAGWIYDTRHDYKGWWLALIVFGLLTLAVTLTMPRPRKRS